MQDSYSCYSSLYSKPSSHYSHVLFLSFSLDVQPSPLSLEVISKRSNSKVWGHYGCCVWCTFPSSLLAGHSKNPWGDLCLVSESPSPGENIVIQQFLLPACMMIDSVQKKLKDGCAVLKGLQLDYSSVSFIPFLLTAANVKRVIRPLLPSVLATWKAHALNMDDLPLK